MLFVGLHSCNDTVGSLRSTQLQHWLTATVVLEWMALPSVFRALLWGALSGATPLTSTVTPTGDFVPLFSGSTARSCQVLVTMLGRHVHVSLLCRALTVPSCRHSAAWVVCFTCSGIVLHFAHHTRRHVRGMPQPQVTAPIFAGFKAHR